MWIDIVIMKRSISGTKHYCNRPYSSIGNRNVRKFLDCKYTLDSFILAKAFIAANSKTRKDPNNGRLSNVLGNAFFINKNKRT